MPISCTEGQHVAKAQTKPRLADPGRESPVSLLQVTVTLPSCAPCSLEVLFPSHFHIL